jgi:succinoglycan biosynthesis protein ExoO
MPYVSVIIPAFNAADFITDAYRSIINQTIGDWEVIFVNDGSQDDTLAKIQSFALSDERVKVIDISSNSGPGHARNAAFAIAAGEWIAVLDADDKYSPDRLEVLTRAGEQSRADVILDNQFVIDPISKRVAFLAFEPHQEEITNLDFVDFLRTVQSNSLFDFGYLKPIIRRRWLAANNVKYQEQLRMGEDLMLFLECYASGAQVKLVSKPYYHYTFQYSRVHRTMSPTTRTDVSSAPLLAAVERFSQRCRSNQSRLARRLVASACEALRETTIAAAFKDYLKRVDIIGVGRCLRHPIRLVRGVYFLKRRSFLLQRRARTAMPGPDAQPTGHV